MPVGLRIMSVHVMIDIGSVNVITIQFNDKVPVRSPSTWLHYTKYYIYHALYEV